ncbi:MAG TPA: phosphoribosylglycinamide formyltransferase [Gemmatimonadaceae bacterium]|nr:phosphoribosylglycinamide formyltransferase [Gemmatimonadaceae bacterium]
MKKRIAVLASGSGSNLAALVEHLSLLGDRSPADVVLVASDREDAAALARADAYGIPARLLDAESRGKGLLALLQSHRIDLVALAGYLRLVPEVVTTAYHGRMVNVHPALLPAFGGRGMYGLKVHQAVLEAGVRVTGVTVHFVDASYDRGPIIAQWPVPVHTDDTPETLAARVLRVEHIVYPRVVCALAEGRVRLEDGGAVSGVSLATVHQFVAARDSNELVQSIESIFG